jgi:hypothetical protein
MRLPIKTIMSILNVSTHQTYCDIDKTDVSFVGLDIHYHSSFYHTHCDTNDVISTFITAVILHVYIVLHVLSG